MTRSNSSRVVNLDEYSNDDPREVPAYGIAEAASFIQIPEATLRSWVIGRRYKTDKGEKFFRPIIRIPPGAPPMMSFMNLVEAHTLSAIRRRDRVALSKVRRSLSFLEEAFPSSHPLLDPSFETDGLDLFISRFGDLICTSQAGQLAARELMKNYLSRIDRDSAGQVRRLYLFTRRRPEIGDEREQPKAVVIDPLVSFGRPVLAGTGVPIDDVVERYEAGEPIKELALDFGRKADEIEEAIRCVLRGRSAA
jgi:uncharacterized protein (DUF433 family)